MFGAAYLLSGVSADEQHVSCKMYVCSGVGAFCCRGVFFQRCDRYLLSRKCLSGVSAGFFVAKYVLCSMSASWLNASIVVTSFQIMSSQSHARFEYTSIAWSTMEGMRSPDEWKRWGENQLWTDLPRGPEMRHRCMDNVMYMGNGYVSHLYSYIQHENVDMMPGWSLCFGCMCFCSQIKVIRTLVFWGVCIDLTSICHFCVMDK